MGQFVLEAEHSVNQRDGDVKKVITCEAGDRLECPVPGLAGIAAGFSGKTF